MEESDITKSGGSSTLPRQTSERDDTELSRWEWSGTDDTNSKQPAPSIKAGKSGLAKLRVNGDESRWPKSGTGETLPTQAKLRTRGAKPRMAQSRMSGDGSKQTLPTRGVLDPDCAEFLADVGSSNCTRSSSSRTKSRRE